MASLVYSLDGEPERSVELGARTLVGRHPGCQVQLLDTAVSKEHFEIEARNHSYWIRDLATLNGTYVNGVRLRSERRLEHLDEIRAVRVQLLFVDPDAAVRRSPTGNPYRRPAHVSEDRGEAPRGGALHRPGDAGDLPILRRFYALVRMLGSESSAKQLAADATHGLLSLCPAEWAVLCLGETGGGFLELARAGRDKPAVVSGPFPALFDVAVQSRAPTFQLGHDQVLQLVVPLVHAGRATGVFWIGFKSSPAISPTIDVLATYASFVAGALQALDAGHDAPP